MFLKMFLKNINFYSEARLHLTKYCFKAIQSIVFWLPLYVSRILRVLENVSNENEENCNYLISHRIENQVSFFFIPRFLF